MNPRIFTSSKSNIIFQMYLKVIISKSYKNSNFKENSLWKLAGKGIKTNNEEEEEEEEEKEEKEEEERRRGSGVGGEEKEEGERKKRGRRSSSSTTTTLSMTC